MFIYFFDFRLINRSKNMIKMEREITIPELIRLSPGLTNYFNQMNNQMRNKINLKGIALNFVK